MCDRERRALHSQLGREFGGFPFDQKSWTPAWLASHFKILPRDSAPQSCADSFHRSFFGGKAPSVALDAVALTFAIGAFRLSEYALEESLAKALNSCAHPLYLANIHARAHDGHA